MTTDYLKTKRSSIQKETNQSQADQEENVEIQICLIFVCIVSTRSVSTSNSCMFACDYRVIFIFYLKFSFLYSFHLIHRFSIRF